MAAQGEDGRKKGREGLIGNEGNLEDILRERGRELFVVVGGDEGCWMDL